MSTLHTEAELVDALGRGVRIVLPNSRAARALRRAYDDRQRATGASVWESAPALSWDEWTRSLWSGLVADGAELRLLLNAAQEHSLWRELIEPATATRSLSSPDSLAELASAAWRLAASHRALDQLQSTATTSDSRTFAQWAEAFARLTAAQDCLSAAQLESALHRRALDHNLRIDSPILIAGFAEFTPSQTALLDALRSSGAQLETAQLAAEPHASAPRAFTLAPTPREELQLAARWIRRLLEDRRDTSPTPCIAVLLSQPEDERGELESVFREILTPELQSIDADLSSTPWEFASGAPLLAQPMIVDALDLLRLIQTPLPLERVSALLRSPFLGRSADRLEAARFDSQTLRRRPLLIPELDLEAIRRRAADYTRQRELSNSPVPWLQPLANLVATKLRGSSARSFAEWAELFRAALNAAGWPGDRSPSALEFETARSWDSTLDLLATLDFRGRRVSQATAMQTLERLLRDARVRPPSASAAVQIMRPGDAAGSVFDAIVLLHATDKAWPGPQYLNPLLGWQLQQRLNLPGASAEADAARARRDAESLLARTSRLLVTCARESSEGRLLPSPLIAQLGLRFTEADDLIEPSIPAPPLVEERITDDGPLPPLPTPELGGGSSVLKLQAACGFRAFAELRLHSDSPDLSALGLDARERGNLVHRALELFWENTRSHGELKSLPAHERDRRLNDAIDAAFTKYSDNEAWSAAYLALQRDRLHHLLSRWLTYELRRSPFTVLQRERSTMIDIGPLRLSVRPDRIDQLPDGGIALVDYKTGAHAKPSDWLGERPDEPQLPLYALLDEPGRLKALLFARIRPGNEMEWRGLETERGILPPSRAKTLTDMEARVADWRRILTSLASDFAAGRADVSPKHRSTCDFCEQRLLCRIHPASLFDIGDDDEEEDANG